MIAGIKNRPRADHAGRLGEISVCGNSESVLEFGFVWNFNRTAAARESYYLRAKNDSITAHVDYDNLIWNARNNGCNDRFSGTIERLVGRDAHLVYVFIKAEFFLAKSVLSVRIMCGNFQFNIVGQTGRQTQSANLGQAI